MADADRRARRGGCGLCAGILERRLRLSDRLGGRPLNSWPIFLLVPFEVGVLAAAVAGFAALLVLCGLPRLHHPLFDSDALERATDDRYFLLVRAPPKAESDGLKVLLFAARAMRIEEQPYRPALVASLALDSVWLHGPVDDQAAALRAKRPRARLHQWLRGTDAAGRRRR